MKNNKIKFLIIPLVVVAAFNSSYAQTKIGVNAGVSFSNVVMKDFNGDKMETNSKPGIQLGLTVDIPITGDFYVQPAAIYANRGFKQKENGFYGLATNFDVRANYIEVPVSLLYKPAIGIGNLMIGAGPYIGYATGGTWKSDNNILIGDIMTENTGKVDFINNRKEGEFGNYIYGKPLDYGLKFSFGYEFIQQVSILFNAQIGLADLYPDYDGVKRSYKTTNKSFGFLLAYTFK